MNRRTLLVGGGAVALGVGAYFAWSLVAGGARREVERRIEDLAAGLGTRSAPYYLTAVDLEDGFQLAISGRAVEYETADRSDFLAAATGWIDMLRGSRVRLRRRQIEVEGDRATAHLVAGWEPPGGEGDSILIVADVALARVTGPDGPRPGGAAAESWRVRRLAIWWGGEALQRMMGGYSSR